MTAPDPDQQELPEWIEVHANGSIVTVFWISSKSICLGSVPPETIELPLSLKMQVEGVDEPMWLDSTVTFVRETDGGGRVFSFPSDQSERIGRILEHSIAHPRQALSLHDVWEREFGLVTRETDSKASRKKRIPKANLAVMAIIGMLALYWATTHPTTDAVIATNVRSVEILRNTDTPIDPDSLVAKGGTVTTGQPLAKLSNAQKMESLRALRAEIEVDRVEAKAIPEQIAALESQLRSQRKVVSAAQAKNAAYSRLLPGGYVSGVAVGDTTASLERERGAQAEISREIAAKRARMSGIYAKWGANFSKADKEIKTLEKLLNDSTTLSPCDCYVLDVVYASGGRMTFVLVDLADPFRIEAAIPSEYLIGYEPGKSRVQYMVGNGGYVWGLYETVLSEPDKTSRVGLPATLWEKNKIIRIKPVDPIPWDRNLVNQPVSVLVKKPWFSLLWAKARGAVTGFF